MINIGLFTFRELIRQRLIHVSLFVAILFFAISFFVGSLSMEQGSRILFHFGFSAIQITLVGISILLGSNLIPKEIERQTCLIILARPIERFQFFVGKWIGVAAVNFCVCSLLTILLWLIVGTEYSLFFFIKVGFGIFFESLILLALAFWCSQFLRPAISLFFTVGIFILGHWLTDLMYFAEKSKSDSYVLFAKIIQNVVPQLYRTDWKSFYLLEKNLISSLEFFAVTLHSFGWTILLLFLGSLTFRRKDLV